MSFFSNSTNSWTTPDALPANASHQVSVAAWAAIIGALLYCPLVTILFRVGWVDQPSSGLLAAIGVLSAVALSFPQLASPQSLGIGALRDWSGLSLFCFTAATALSTLIAQLGERSGAAEPMWRQFAMAFLPILLFFVAREWARVPQSHRPIAAGLDLLTAACVASVGLDVTGIFAFESYGARSFGVLGDAAAWLLSALAVLHLSSRRWVPFWLVLLCLLATASRGPVLVAMTSLVLFAILQPGRTHGALNLRIAAIAALLLAALFANQFAPAVVERFLQTDLFSNDRIDTTRFSFEVFLREPLFGSGYNSHSYYFAQIFGEAYEGSTVYSVATSTLAQSLADAGVFGTFFLVVAYATLIRVAFRVLTQAPSSNRALRFTSIARGLAAWLIAFVPLNQTAGYILPNSQLGAFFFFAAGVLVGYLRPR